MTQNVANNLHCAGTQPTENTEDRPYASTAAVQTTVTLIPSQYSTKQGEVGKKFDRWCEIKKSTCVRCYLLLI